MRAARGATPLYTHLKIALLHFSVVRAMHSASALPLLQPRSHFPGNILHFKNWSVGTFLEFFLNLSDWRSDWDGDWMLSLSNIGSLVASRMLNAALTHVSTCCVKAAKPTVTAIGKCCLREIVTLDGLVVIEANTLRPPLIPPSATTSPSV